MKSGVGGLSLFSSGSLVNVRRAALLVVGRDRFSPITDRNLVRAVWGSPFSGDLARENRPLMALPMVGVGAREVEAKDEEGMMGFCADGRRCGGRGVEASM